MSRGLAPGKTPLEVEQKLEKCVPAKFKLHAHHWLILHGRYTCVARKPHCPTCVVRDLCRYPDKTAESGEAKKRAKQPAAKKAAVRKRAAKRLRAAR